MKKLALFSFLFFCALNSHHIKAANWVQESQGGARDKVFLTRENIAREARNTAFGDLNLRDIEKKVYRLGKESPIQGANAEDEDFSGLNLEGVFFFPKINFSYSDLSYTTIENVIFWQCTFNSVSFEEFKTIKGFFINCDFSDTDFERAHLQKVTFSPISPKGACFPFADFSGKQFIGLDFSGFEFNRANFKECTFKKVKLERTNFSGASLVRACFGATSSLKGTNFTHADLRNALFIFDKMSKKDQAIFKHADLRGLKIKINKIGFLKENNLLKGAIVTQEQIENSRLTPKEAREKGLLTPKELELLCSRYIKEGIKEVTDETYSFFKLQLKLSSLTLGFYLADFNPKSISPKKKSKPLPR